MDLLNEYRLSQDAVHIQKSRCFQHQPFFFPLSFGLFSCQAYRKAHTAVALRSEFYKQEKTNSRNQTFSSSVILRLWMPSSYLFECFSSFFRIPACVTQGLLRQEPGGRGFSAHRSFLQDREAMILMADCGWQCR